MLYNVNKLFITGNNNYYRYRQTKFIISIVWAQKSLDLNNIDSLSKSLKYAMSSYSGVGGLIDKKAKDNILIFLNTDLDKFKHSNYDGVANTINSLIDNISKLKTDH